MGGKKSIIAMGTERKQLPALQSKNAHGSFQQLPHVSLAVWLIELVIHSFIRSWGLKFSSGDVQAAAPPREGSITPSHLCHP